MFFIKKSSLFFSKSILLQNCFYNNNILAFYDYFSLTSLNFFFFKSFILEFNLGFFLLSSSFVSFFFRFFFFFFFFKPGIFLVFTNSFEDFFKFELKIKDLNSFFLLAFSFKYLFFNSKFINNLNSITLFELKIVNFFINIFNNINIFFIIFYYFFYFIFLEVFLVFFSKTLI